MTTTIDFALAKLKLGQGIADIATPIARNYGLGNDVEDIVSETYVRLLEDYNLYAHKPQYRERMQDQSYYNKAVRNKVRLVCERRSDPFTYYYRPEWIRDNIKRLLDVARTESDLVEIVDFRVAWGTLTDRQREAIERGERSGSNAQNGFDKLIRSMNRSKPNTLARIDELVELGVL